MRAFPGDGKGSISTNSRSKRGFYPTVGKHIALEAIETSRTSLVKFEIVADATKAMEKWRRQMEAAMEYLEDEAGFQTVGKRDAKRPRKSADKESSIEDDLETAAITQKSQPRTQLSQTASKKPVLERTWWTENNGLKILTWREVPSQETSQPKVTQRDKRPEAGKN